MSTGFLSEGCPELVCVGGLKDEDGAEDDEERVGAEQTLSELQPSPQEGEWSLFWT